MKERDETMNTDKTERAISTRAWEQVRFLHRRFWIWLRSSRHISVGHCVTQSGNGVMLTLGRKSAGLTPAGARLVASQLNSWADHAEAMGEAIATMKYIIKVRVNALDGNSPQDPRP